MQEIHDLASNGKVYKETRSMQSEESFVEFSSCNSPADANSKCSIDMEPIASDSSPLNVHFNKCEILDNLLPSSGADDLVAWSISEQHNPQDRRASKSVDV